MEHATKMLRSYLVRFTVRALVLLCVLVTFLTDREQLDFTRNRALLHPINLLWLLFLVSFAFQLSPKSRVSRGCLKQFPEHFDRIEAAVDGFRLRTRLERLDLGATRVALLWIALNLVFLVLYLRGVIGVPTLVLLATFYYLSDLICIIFYCPFQKLVMKNKCCVTCRIFAWGTIMIATPLLFVPHFWSWSLVALALVCTALWEVTYYRHPERFVEETNAFLVCENCTDRLCVIKKHELHRKFPRR
ncbi:MAG: hypothetical protein IJT71_01805 [Oscillospiraceae bacterium]|nr:hypothetical protein [Oscillospiraceae bacterium]